METKRLKTADGTVVHYINVDGTNKMHNWESAAYIPGGVRSKAEYYLFGFRYSKDEFLDRKRDGIGEPFYKTSVGKAAGARV